MNQGSAVSEVSDPSSALAPLASATSLLVIPMKVLVMMFRNSELGTLVVTTTVAASGVSMLWIGAAKNAALLLRFFRRSQDHLMSLASTGVPSENLAFGSSLKVKVFWSALTSQLAARSGAIFCSGSSVTSVS